MQYAVQQGAASATSTQFAALSQSSSQHTYQIQVSSENVFVDKAVDWTSTCNLQFNTTVAADQNIAGQPVVRLGVDFALAAFPLHCLVNTMTATINDTTVSCNLGDILYEVLRLSDSKKNRTLRTCPTYLDTYASYDDAYGTSNNPIAGYENATSNDTVPNGAFHNIIFCDKDGVSLDGQPSYTVNGQTINVVKGIPVQTASVLKYPIFIKFTSTEKLVLSPFTYNDCHDNETGLFGLQNISITMNMSNPSPKNLDTRARVIRYTKRGGRTIEDIGYLASLPFQGSNIRIISLTPSLNLPLPAVSKVNYFEFPRYQNSYSQAIVSGDKINVSSQTITLNCVPDMLIIYAKPNKYKATDADFYLPLSKLNLQWDNFSGQCSTFEPYQLWSISNQAGLTDMDYNQWLGYAVSNNPNNTENPYVGLTGGFLCLQMGRDIQLQTGLAPSVVGNFTLSFSADVYNPSNNDIISSEGFSIYVITANSGFFTTVRGSSKVEKGVLSSKDVLEADNKGAVTKSDLKRYVGGSFFKGLSNMVSKAMPVVKAIAPYAKMALPLPIQAGLAVAGYGKHGISKRLM
jgi:hypothetical protein